MSYVRWVKLQNAWVPLHNIPGTQMGTPTPAEPEMPQQAVPAPPDEAAPVPAPPMNVPEALNIPEFSEPIQRVSS